jgi:hypothetical protein
MNVFATYFAGLAINLVWDFLFVYGVPRLIGVTFWDEGLTRVTGKPARYSPVWIVVWFALYPIWVELFCVYWAGQPGAWMSMGYGAVFALSAHSSWDFVSLAVFPGFGLWFATVDVTLGVAKTALMGLAMGAVAAQ